MSPKQPSYITHNAVLSASRQSSIIEVTRRTFWKAIAPFNKRGFAFVVDNRERYRRNKHSLNVTHPYDCEPDKL